MSCVSLNAQNHSHGDNDENTHILRSFYHVLASLHPIMISTVVLLLYFGGAIVAPTDKQLNEFVV